MIKVTNITAGPKGLHNKDGELVMIEGGAAAEVDVAAGDLNKEWFAHGDKAPKDAPKPE